jgi:hypothetical protein
LLQTQIPEVLVQYFKTCHEWHNVGTDLDGTDLVQFTTPSLEQVINNYSFSQGYTFGDEGNLVVRTSTPVSVTCITIQSAKE